MVNGNKGERQVAVFNLSENKRLDQVAKALWGTIKNRLCNLSGVCFCYIKWTGGLAVTFYAALNGWRLRLTCIFSFNVVY